jgi:flagellar basal-body rod protein FlgB
MFIDRMLNGDNEPLLEQWLKFTARRHKLIAENVVNIDTPGYQQKDLSVEKFQAALRDRVEQRDASGQGNFNFSGTDLSADVDGVLFHDGATRSPEQLMSDQAKNAMMHNLVIELLRDQFQQLEMAIKERPS